MSEKINNENVQNAKSVKKIIADNKVKISIIAAIIVAIAILIPIGYALFSDTENKQSEIKLGTIQVDLVEDWPDRGDTITTDDDETETYDEFGISKKTKKVWGESKGNLDAYVRIRCIPVVEYNNRKDGTGEWITVPVAQGDIVVTVNGEDWIQQGDYWYYKNILKPTKETSKMQIDWNVTELPSELEGYAVRTDVRVILEYAQTTNEKWKTLFQIDDLPAGVQRVE